MAMVTTMMIEELLDVSPRMALFVNSGGALVAAFRLLRRCLSGSFDNQICVFGPQCRHRLRQSKRMRVRIPPFAGNPLFLNTNRLGRFEPERTNNRHGGNGQNDPDGRFRRVAV